MANAIITEEFRKNQATLLIADITKAQTNSELGYYIGIGKSDTWNNTDTAPVPDGSKIEQEDVINNLIALARIESAAICKLAIKTGQEWSTGQRYKVYNPGDLNCFNTDTANSRLACYTIYESKVYLCLGNGVGGQSNASAVATQNPPNSTAIGQPVANGDDPNTASTDAYIWVLIGDLIPGSEFGESQTFFELPNAPATNSAATEASGGLIHGFDIVNPGAGYSFTTNDVPEYTDATLRYTRLDGITASSSLKVEIINGEVKRVCNSSVTSQNNGDFSFTQLQALGKGSANAPKGAKVSRATLEITGNTGTPTTSAVINVLIGPAAGYGVSDNLLVFPPFFLGLSFDFEQNTTGDTLTDITFRQVSIIKNPLRANDQASTTSGIALDSSTFDYGDADTTVNTMDSLQSVAVTAGTLPTITAGTTTSGWYMVDDAGERAWIDYIDTRAGEERIFFHQNSKFVHSGNAAPNQFRGSTGDPWPSTAAGAIQIYDGGGNAQGSGVEVGAVDAAEHVEETGTVIFLENRSGITRTSAQTERVRIILQL